MSSFFQIPFETPEEPSSDLLWPPGGAPTPMFPPPQGVSGEPRRLRSTIVAVGVAGLLVLGSYGLAEGQTAFQCDPQYSFCYPGYEGYYGGGHRGWGGREGGHEGFGRGGGAFEANAGGFGDSGFGGGFGGASAAHGFGGFGGAGAGHGGGGFGG